MQALLRYVKVLHSLEGHFSSSLLLHKARDKPADGVEPFPLDLNLQALWASLGHCLELLGDFEARKLVVKQLQPAVEAFFVCHQQARPIRRLAQGLVVGGMAEMETPSAESEATLSTPDVPLDSGTAGADGQAFFPDEASALSVLSKHDLSFLRFLEAHRAILNDIVKAASGVRALSNGPYAILTRYPHVLDFEVKTNFFRQLLKRQASGFRRGRIPLRIRR
jgi:E3 ubiquitin-protein ligase HUWE1